MQSVLSQISVCAPPSDTAGGLEPCVVLDGVEVEAVLEVGGARRRRTHLLKALVRAAEALHLFVGEDEWTLGIQQLLEVLQLFLAVGRHLVRQPPPLLQYGRRLVRLVVALPMAVELRDRRPTVEVAVALPAERHTHNGEVVASGVARY